MRKILEFSSLFSLVLFIFATSADCQEKLRTVHDIYLPKDAPVQIVDRKIDGVKMNAENRGLGNSNWIKNLTFEVRNVSEKNVTYVEIMLMVPQQGQMPAPSAYLVMFGSRDGSDANGSIEPGSSANIKVTDGHFSQWEKRFEEWGVSDFDWVSLQLRAVYFDDNTVWMNGALLRRDPNDPKRFILMDLFSRFAQTADEKEREIIKPFVPYEPVEFLQAGNSRNALNLNEKFKQDRDWLKGFTISVKNISEKTITFIALGLDFPETVSSGNMMSFPLVYGGGPLSSAKVENVEPVQKGKSVDLTLSQKQYENLKSFIETRHILNDLSKVNIRLAMVVFEDGTGWSSGTFVRPDPNDPKKFIAIDSK